MPEKLTTEAAKARLREVCPELEVASWVEKRPFSTLLIAAATGVLVARAPRNMLIPLLDVLMQVVLPGDEDPRQP